MRAESHGGKTVGAGFSSKGDARAYFRALRESLDVEQRAEIDSLIAQQVASLPQFGSAEVLFTYVSVGCEVDTRELIRHAWNCGKTVAVPRCIAHSRQMSWHLLRSFDELERNAFGIDEPADDPATLIEVPALASMSGTIFAQTAVPSTTTAPARMVAPNTTPASSTATAPNTTAASSTAAAPTPTAVPSTTDAPAPASSACKFVALVPGFTFDAEGNRLGYGGGFYDAFLPGFGGVSVGLCRSCQMSPVPLPMDSHDFPVNLIVTEVGAQLRLRAAHDH